MKKLGGTLFGAADDGDETVDLAAGDEASMPQDGQASTAQ